MRVPVDTVSNWYNSEKGVIMNQEQRISRVEEMRRLRVVEGWTLKKIGQEFGGISRERVRQLIGNTGKYFRREWTERYIDDGRPQPKHYSEMDNAPGLKKVWQERWSEFRHEAKSGAVLIGQEFEEWISMLLDEHGIKNKLMPNHHPFNILTESGIRIDVKSSNLDARDLPSQHCVSPTWCFAHFKRGRDCDFFVACCPDQEELDGYTYFVIPAHEFNHTREDYVMRIPWPIMGQKDSKWTKYHQRIDLLELD